MTTTKTRRPVTRVRRRPAGRVIREQTHRLGFEVVCERYGEDVVRAAWLPED